MMVSWKCVVLIAYIIVCGRRPFMRRSVFDLVCHGSVDIMRIAKYKIHNQYCVYFLDAASKHVVLLRYPKCR